LPTAVHDWKEMFSPSARSPAFDYRSRNWAVGQFDRDSTLASPFLGCGNRGSPLIAQLPPLSMPPPLCPGSPLRFDDGFQLGVLGLNSRRSSAREGSATRVAGSPGRLGALISQQERAAMAEDKRSPLSNVLIICRGWASAWTATGSIAKQIQGSYCRVKPFR
jgi:hypothetical protein